MLFRMLGPVAVERDGEEIHLPGGRERCLLCVLLLAAGQPVPTDRLISLLWVEQPPAGARAAIHTYLSRLRRTLAAHLGPHEAALSRRGDCYVLGVDPDLVDIHRFGRLVEQARRTDDPGGRAQTLRRALELWRGPVAADVVPIELRERIAGNHDQLRLTAVRLYVEAELASGQHQGVIDALTGLVTEFPFDEDLVGQLMLALYRSGRRSEALDVYRQSRTRIATELGLDPSDRLREMEAAILRADPSLQLAGGQKPGSTVPAQLPAAVDGFVGRADLLDTLDGMLPNQTATNTPALVISAIAGMGGVGKTTLAVHWGHRVAHLFRDGQLYVDLRGWATGPPVRPIEVLAGFLRALGLPDRRIPLDLAEAAALYRSVMANRRMLIVLDNAGNAGDVRPLLPGAPGCLVLVTSRARLAGLIATHGARRLTLDALTAEESVSLLREMLGPRRVAAEARAAADLSNRCGRLPLALRIAAANLAEQPSTTIADYSARLARDDGIAALAIAGDPTTSVTATLQLSYQRLPLDDQLLLRWLALTPAVDVTADSAAVIRGTTTATAGDLLRQLADVCLLDEHRPGRFAPHDLVRAFGVNRSYRDDTAAVRAAVLDRWYDWYLHHAQAAATLVFPTYEFPPASTTTPSMDAVTPLVGTFDTFEPAKAWLDAEWPNLHAAIRHAADQGPRRYAWLLTHAVRGYLWMRRNIVDWDTTARAGLAAAEATDDPFGKAVAHQSLGALYTVQDAHQQAIDHLTAMLNLSRQVGWPAGEASACSNLGMLHWKAGRLDEAHAHLDLALTLYRHLGRPAGESAVLTKLGTVHSAAGRLQQAAQAYRQALAIDANTKSRVARAHNNNNLGNAYHALGQLDAAFTHLATALDLARHNGDRGLEVDISDSLANALCTSGKYGPAIQHATASLRLAQEIGDRSGQAHAQNTLGTIHLSLGNHAEAITRHRQALDIATETDSGFAHTTAMIGLTRALAATGQSADAVNHGHSALDHARSGGYRLLEGQAHIALSQAYLAAGHLTHAGEHARHALAIHHAAGHLAGEAEAAQLLRDIQH
jgi:DNA-binding SARP family transcriptional activator/Tfp pilus assembly protein PilF